MIMTKMKMNNPKHVRELRQFEIGDVYRPQAFVMKVAKDGQPKVVYMGGQIYEVIDNHARNPFK